MLIAMAGLPATGKSTIAACLAKELGGVVLGKDEVRTSLFPPPVLDYSTAQDDLVMQAIFQAATYIVRANAQQVVILDGRTFLRAYQVNDLLNLASLLQEPMIIIECVCQDEVAKDRLEQDRVQGKHPAGNRTYELYLEVKACAEPITVAHLVLDTGQLSLPECVERCLAYVRSV